MLHFVQHDSGDPLALPLPGPTRVTWGMTASCVLCSSTLGPVIAQEAHWAVVLNRNQNLLGKLMLVLRRHAEAVPDLRPEEWTELHSVMGRATGALTALFAPEHFNYAFLQNQDRHIHLHVVPRYSGPRLFAGQIFADPDYPAHYAVPAPVRPLAPEDRETLAEQLRRAYGSPPTLSSPLPSPARRG